MAIVIRFQKQIDGELWVVIACPYCGAMVRLDKEMADELCSCLVPATNQYRLSDSGHDTYNSEIASRIMAGYN